MTFTYKPFDAVETRTDARGTVTTYGYDALNRLETVTYNTSSAPGVASTSNTTIVYKTSAQGKGQVSSVTDGLGSETYSYDSMGRVSSKTRTIDARSYQTQYQYNTANQLTLMVYPSGKRVRVNRDTRGRLSGVDKVDSGGTTLLSYLSNVGYNTAGQVTGLNLGNGVAETYGYSNDRLQMISQTATKGGSTLMSLTYSYSASAGASGTGTSVGNSGQLMSITGTINSQNRNQAFTYDNVGRLTTATGWSAWQRRFAYDRWGNRTGVWNATSGGTQLQSVALQMSGSVPTNRISNVGGVNYVYDANGNVTNDGAYSYTYDAESRMVSVSVGGSGSYGYDSANRRIKKVASGTTTHYVWEGGQVIAEYDGTSGALVNEYVNAGGRMIREQGSAIRYYQSDRLSTRFITDGTGAVVGTEDHLPFGEDAGVVGESEKHRFTSYERDSESGSDYAVNRQYSNVTGRFTRPDPVAGGIGSPQNLNRYAYSLNDPVDLTDPAGLMPFIFPHVIQFGPKVSMSVSAGGWGDEWIVPIPAFLFSLKPFGQINLDSRTIAVMQGVQEAGNAIKKGPCRNLFGDVDPTQLLNTLLSNGLIQVNYASPEIGGGDPPTPFTDVRVGAVTTYSAGLVRSGNRMSTEAVITINQSGPFFSGLAGGMPIMASRRGGFWSLTMAQARGAMIIHELLHTRRKIPSDGNNSEQSRRNSEIVRLSCFVEIGKLIGSTLRVAF